MTYGVAHLVGVKKTHVR